MTIEERLRQVEEELASARCVNRRIFAAAAIAAVGFGLVWACAEGEPRTKIVRGANEFYISDQDGTRRAVLGVGEDGPALDLYDHNGARRVSLGVGMDGPALLMFDENGLADIALRVEAGHPQLFMYHGHGGRPAIWLGPPSKISHEEFRRLVRAVYGLPEPETPDDEERADDEEIRLHDSFIRLWGRDGEIRWFAP